MVMLRSIYGAESRFHFPKVSTLLLLALVTFPAAVSAANDRVGQPEAVIDSLTIYPEVSFQHLELTVAGNGVHVAQTFGPGEAAVFSMQDTPLPDGQYRYELIASPPLNHASLEAAGGDFELSRQVARLEQTETYRQVGQFDVINGEIFLLDDPDGVPSSRMPDEARKGGGQ